jgi:hypothetical protein
MTEIIFLGQKKNICMRILKVWNSKKTKYIELLNLKKKIYTNILEIITNIQSLYSKGLLPQEDYNISMESTENLVLKYKEIENSFLQIKINSIYLYYTNFKNKLLELKLEVIIISKSNTSKMSNILDLEDINLGDYSNINLKLFNFYNKMFTSIEYLIHNVENNMKDTKIKPTSIVKYNNLFSNNDYEEKKKIFLNKIIKDYSNTSMSSGIICKIPDYNRFNNLGFKVSGCCIFLFFKKQIFVFTGLILDDPLGFSFIGGTLGEKHLRLTNTLIENNPDNKKFIKNYVDSINLRNMICLSEDEIIEDCLSKINMLKKYKCKSISTLVKDFLSSDQISQRDILSLFLMADCNEQKYIAYLLFDMVSQSSFLIKPQLCNEGIYTSLPWCLKKNFKIAINQIQNSQISDKDTEIPYDKQILLMKCSDSIKNKAMEKFKEINAKGTDNASKAQCYLDALLRIPFGIYITESILAFLEDFAPKCLIYKESLFKNKKLYIGDLKTRVINNCNELNNKITSNKVNNFLKENNICMLDIKNNLLSYNLENILKICFTKYKTKPGLFNFVNLISNLSNFNLNISNKVLKNDLKKTLETFFNLNFKNLDYDLKINILKKCNFEYNTNISQGLLNLINKGELLNNEWDKYKKNKIVYLKNVESALDKSVYGHKEAKQQISRICAQWITGEKSGYCFGFEGPPGCGKTSLAKQGLSHILKDDNGKDRPFIFIPLGGSCQGSVLEGHLYTYVGSTWGKICDALMESKCMNPIIYFDECDKISETAHGNEICGILTHMTDPSQNSEFYDKYFSGIPLDLSKCLFVFSYNDGNKIDRILKDRIHEINFKSLTLKEKLVICQDYMIPEISNSVGIKDEVIFTDEIIEYMISEYTYEAGVRKIKEKLFECIREINYREQMGLHIDNKEIIYPFKVSKAFLSKDLFSKYPKVHIKKICKEPKIGLVNGLYATSLGIGGLTTVECYPTVSTEKGKIISTGTLGDCMKESIQVAKTVAWCILPKDIKNKIKEAWKDEPYGYHLHAPEGATPKDGPSAGAAIASCLFSSFSGVPLNNEVALTGELDLNGNIRAIGGLESKLTGACVAGVKLALVPEENKHDVTSIMNGDNPPKIEIKLCSTIWEVLSHLLMPNDLNIINHVLPDLY